MEDIGYEFEIIWLDGMRSNNVNELDYFNRKIDLGNLINHLHVFNNTENCLEYLATLDVANQVLFIVSGVIGKDTLSKFHEQSQIICFYIFCNDAIEHREWASQYPKVRGVYNKSEDLLQKLQQDVQFLRHHFIPANIFSLQDVHQKSFQNVNKEKAIFLWFQLLIDVLERLPKSERSKQDLIDECRQCYLKNDNELRKISYFETNYEESQAIEWYTRDCFLFRLINRAFRTRNIDNIFRFRYFFIDLQKQLSKVHEQQLPLKSSETLYRGQVISAGELQHLQDNIGGIYSVNTFFSTTTNSHVALKFQEGAFGKPYFECVLFEILVENKTNSKWRIPFADIHEVSFNKDEGEVLFGMGTVFSIDGVTSLTDNLWLVNLTLLEGSGIDESLREYYLKNSIGQTSSLMVLSELLHEMGQTAQAKRYCEILLDENASHEEKMQIYTHLIYYEYKLDNLVAAKHRGEIALELQHSSKVIIPTIYSHMGLVSSALGEYSKALKYYQVATEIERQKNEKVDEEMAVGYLNLGMAYYDLSMFKSALYWTEKMALQSQRKILPDNHPGLAVTYSNISNIYIELGSYKLARSNLEKAVEIQKNNLPPFHFEIHITLSNLAEACQLLGEYDNALKYYREAQEIIINTSSSNSKLFAENYLSIAAVYDCQGDNKKALFYNKMALKRLSKNKLEHRRILATVYNNMGMLFINMKYYKHALKCLIKAWSIEKRILDPTHTLLMTTLSNIGMAYGGYGLLKKALYVHRQVLDIRKFTLNQDHPDLATTWDNIGVIYYKMGRYKKAIKLYHRALHISATALPIDHPSTICICEHLGDVYRRLGKQKLAQKYYYNPERMAQASLKTRTSMMLTTTETESLEDDQIEDELDLFTLGYIKSLNDTNITANSAD